MNSPPEEINVNRMRISEGVKRRVPLVKSYFSWGRGVLQEYSRSLFLRAFSVRLFPRAFFRGEERVGVDVVFFNQGVCNPDYIFLEKTVY